MDECSEPLCNRSAMVALTPMHPMTYYDLCCETHRARVRATANSYMLKLYLERGERPDWAIPRVSS